MKRPMPNFRIHDNTSIHARRPDSEAWQSFVIVKKTRNVG